MATRQRPGVLGWWLRQPQAELAGRHGGQPGQEKEEERGCSVPGRRKYVRVRQWQAQAKSSRPTSAAPAGLRQQRSRRSGEEDDGKRTALGTRSAGHAASRAASSSREQEDRDHPDQQRCNCRNTRRASSGMLPRCSPRSSCAGRRPAHRCRRPTRLLSEGQPDGRPVDDGGRGRKPATVGVAMICTGSGTDARAHQAVPGAARSIAVAATALPATARAWRLAAMPGALVGATAPARKRQECHRARRARLRRDLVAWDEPCSATRINLLCNRIPAADTVRCAAGNCLVDVALDGRWHGWPTLTTIALPFDRAVAEGFVTPPSSRPHLW